MKKHVFLVFLKKAGSFGRGYGINEVFFDGHCAHVEIMTKPALTHKRETFARLYVEHGDASKAYREGKNVVRNNLVYQKGVPCHPDFTLDGWEIID